MEPVYSAIEFCSSAETLWEKVKSGKWEWLGVHPKGQFVVGYGRRRTGGTTGSLTVTGPGAPEGRHGWRATASGHGLRDGGRWASTPEEAREQYDAAIAEWRSRGSNFLAKIELVI